MRVECVILERARQLAVEKGLDPGAVRCNFVGTCDGTDCKGMDQPQTRFFNFVSKEPQPKNPSQAFYARLQKTLNR